MCIAEFLAVASGLSLLIFGTIMTGLILKIRSKESGKEKSPTELK